MVLKSNSTILDSRIIYHCEHCGFTEQNHQGGNIPILEIPNQILPVQPLEIFDQKMRSIVNLNCISCLKPVHGTYMPDFGKTTVICIDRSPRTYTQGDTPQKIQTRLNSVSTQTNIGELICVINHLGHFGAGHFVAYTKVNNIWYCHDDSNPMFVCINHPFNVLRQSETNDLLIYYKP